MDKYKDLAETQVVQYDEEFVELTSEDREKQEDLKKLCTTSFWGSISAKDYVQTLEAVIPTFWKQPNVQDLVENGRAKKTNLQKILSPYLKKLLEIADGKVAKDEYLIYTGSLSLDHISDKYERLALLLWSDRTQRQAKTIASHIHRQWCRSIHITKV